MKEQNTQKVDVKPTYIEEVIQKLATDENEEEDLGKFTWEEDVERSWNQLVENNGILQHVSDDKGSKTGREKYKQRHTTPLRKGVFRHLIILLDMSYNMKERDYKPDRINVLLECIDIFLKKFFYKNPVGHIGVIALKKNSAKLIQPFTSNSDDILNSIKKERTEGLDGLPSLQEGLEISNELLNDAPPYGTKEILILYGSIRTCDKKNILATLDVLVQNHVYVNCISIAPEMFVLKQICKETNGIHKVVLDKHTLKEEMINYSETPLWMKGMEPQLIHICFPMRTQINTKILCPCHNSLHTETFSCNFCNSKVCRIPSKCKICGIYLVSMQDLSHVSNNLEEAPFFEDIENKNHLFKTCNGCNKKLEEQASMCEKCKTVFCVECDIYIHEELNQCPFCIMNEL